MSDIVLKDRNGVKNVYSGVEELMIADTNGNYNKYIPEPTETTTLTKNGLFDVSKFKFADVQVEGGGQVEEYDGTIIIEGTPSGDQYDFVVNVGYEFALPVDPSADQEDYELIINPSGIVDVRKEGLSWVATALKAGVCTIAIDDTDETIYSWSVKVVE